MYHNYKAFVKPSNSNILLPSNVLSGEEAKKLYLEEISESEPTSKPIEKSCASNTQNTRKHFKVHSNPVPDKDLFLLVQNNDVDQLKNILDDHPNKIDCLDEYGWSLLMIACQANAVEVVEELLKRGIDTSVRDKAGNSAYSLIIRNKNVMICDILLKYRTEGKNHTQKDKHQFIDKPREEFFCKRCNKTFPDKQEHLSSTIHNICASKGKKPMASYAIPTSNKGFQIMLKTGWDRDKGLGPEGSGKMYPIKPVLKLDKHGLGHKKIKLKEDPKQGIQPKSSKLVSRSQYNDRRMEINFRREFY